MGIGIVCGAAGANLTTYHVLVLGFSGLAALSIGLGINEFLSFRAQNLFLLNEYVAQRELLELRRDDEIRGVVDLLVVKGVERADAESVVTTLSKYNDFFLNDFFMPIKAQQLMLTPPSQLLEIWPLIAEACSTFLAVLAIGALPLLGSVAAYAGKESREQLAFIVFYVLAALILFVMGALKSCFYGVKWYTAGIQTLAVGLACGLAGFLTGAAVSGSGFVAFLPTG